MTNPILNNEIGNTEVILWQYDLAWNLIHLIESWNTWAKASCQDFWDKFWGETKNFKHGTFFIDSADTFGLNVWGNMLGIPRPTIKIPVGLDSKTDTVTTPDSQGNLVSGYDEYGYNTDGYKVVNVSTDQQWKTVTIQNTLYRCLLKGRYFLMCHKPTVPNYNKYLSIVFGANKNGGLAKFYDIFDEYGNVKAGYTTRNRALDFQNMTMNFTFPENASVEEAYLIFQHYDLVYQFPAGIRYAGEFIDDNLVIGLNTDQDPGTANNQNYKNFVDGVIPAENDTQFPNGGIFSTTDRANYKVPTTVAGRAFIIRVTESDLSGGEVTMGIVFEPVESVLSSRQAVWIDWGNGQCGYNYMPKGEDDSKVFSSKFSMPGLYAVMMLYDSSKLSLVEPGEGWAITSYNLCAGGAE